MRRNLLRLKPLFELYVMCIPDGRPDQPFAVDCAQLDIVHSLDLLADLLVEAAGSKACLCITGKRKAAG